MNATEVIKFFNLEPLEAEGGYFKRIYCSSQNAQYDGESCPIVSAIYYLITPDNFSALHVLKRDEIFHFYGGDSVEFIKIQGGKLETIRFGSDFAKGEVPQIAVEGGVWQALRIGDTPTAKHGWALIGTTVSPAFEYTDFLVGKRADLLKQFPNLASTIKRFTRE